MKRLNTRLNNLVLHSFPIWKSIFGASWEKSILLVHARLEKNMMGAFVF